MPLILLFIACCTQNCNYINSQSAIQDKDSLPRNHNIDISIPGNFSKITNLHFDSTAVQQFFLQFPLMLPYKKEVSRFYTDRNYSFAWYDNNGLLEQSQNLYNRLLNLSLEGLPDTVLYKDAFTGLMQNEGLDSTNQPLITNELMLTAQYFMYAKNVWGGLDEKTTNELNWYLPRKKVAYGQLLDSLLKDETLLTNAPVYRQYNLLKSALAKYKAIEAKGGFPVIVVDKKVYKTGDTSVAIVAIRKELFLTGDLKNDNGSNIFDTALATGVLHFQGRMGEQQDAVIGPAMLAELKVSVEKRIQQLMINMERSRWVPVALKGDYLLINIPEYKLHVIANDSLLWSMNVVVGTATNKTVIFNGNIKYIVFSPYWNVPGSIFKKEVLPGIKRNPNYLANHNMEWNGNGVRQKPGANNSLGLVKFLFPNSFDIYLHDTPSKSLFGETNRAFSHGCIRLAQPQKLAEYLLSNDSSWNTDKIVAAMNSGKEKYVTLTQTMPVFIAYFTAWVDRQGQLNFRKDVYNRDSRLIGMMMEK